MKSRKHIFIIVGLVLIGAFIMIGFQKSNEATRSIFDEFQNEERTVLRLETDMTQLLSNKTVSSYQDATLMIQNEDESTKEFGIKVKTRGVTRKRICDLPPLKLKFDPQDLEKNTLKNYKTLKLVTHCQEEEDFEQLLYKEYLAYKMYNCLTEKSFRVQLVKIEYVDSNTGVTSKDHYGFIIENKKEMADRLQAKLMKNRNQPLKQIDAEQYRLFTFFQYMIGNTDWNLSKQHNIKMLAADDTHGPIPVPYDFDFAGLVNSPYAKPYPTLPIKKVTERFFQFRGKKDADFSPVYDLFNQKKMELFDMCVNFDLLEDKVKIEMVAYLESFFKLIDEQRRANVQDFAVN